MPSWKRRWAVLRLGALCYYTDADCATLKGSVMLSGCRARLVHIPAKEAPRSMGAQMGFELEMPSWARQTLLAFPSVATPTAATKEDASPWVIQLNEAIEELDRSAGWLGAVPVAAVMPSPPPPAVSRARSNSTPAVLFSDRRTDFNEGADTFDRQKEAAVSTVATPTTAPSTAAPPWAMATMRRMMPEARNTDMRGLMGRMMPSWKKRWDATAEQVPPQLWARPRAYSDPDVFGDIQAGNPLRGHARRHLLGETTPSSRHGTDKVLSMRPGFGSKQLSSMQSVAL